MTIESTAVVRRLDYRLERARGASWRREASIELDLASIVLLAGRCRAVIGDQQYEATAPAIFLINPGLNLALEGTSDGALYEHLALELKQPAIDRALDSVGMDRNSNLLFAEPRPDLVISIELQSRRIVAEFEGDLPGRDAAFDLGVSLLAIDLLRTYARIDLTSKLERSRVGLVDRRLRRAIEYMHDNYERDLSVGEIAAEAFLSEFHFARLFKRVTGQSPHAYLSGVRMSAAERLLAETDLPVSAVGERVGYQSASHFAKLFRAAAGMSPTAFRDALVK
jgi:AraC family transcriptional regulator